MDADGSNPHPVTNDPFQDWHPSWSPDGRKLAFTSDRSGNIDIWVINADGSEARNLTNHPATDWHPAWSPDGTRIAFVSYRDGPQSDIWVMNINTGELHNITRHSAGYAYHSADYAYLTWSPDGTKIAFASDRGGASDIWVIDMEKGDLRNVTNDSYWDGDPSWSPTSNEIVFVSDRDGAWHLWVISADGSHLRRLTKKPGDYSDPAWSPDGRQIVFAQKTDDRWEIRVISSDGANEYTVMANPAWKCFEPAWALVPKSVPAPPAPTPLVSTPIHGSYVDPAYSTKYPDPMIEKVELVISPDNSFKFIERVWPGVQVSIASGSYEVQKDRLILNVFGVNIEGRLIDGGIFFENPSIMPILGSGVWIKQGTPMPNRQQVVGEYSRAEKSRETLKINGDGTYMLTYTVVGVLQIISGKWVLDGYVMKFEVENTTSPVPLPEQVFGITGVAFNKYICLINFPEFNPTLWIKGATQLGQIRGRVTDAITGKGIAAKVEASGPTTASATADANGNYTLSLAPGTYNLTASATGYQSQTKTDITVTAGQTTTVNFVLTPLAPGNRPPDPPVNLAQLLPDGTAIPVGGTVDTDTVFFKANVTDPDGNQVKLQVELRRLDELGGGFDEAQGGLKESALVASGEQASVSVFGLIPGHYHWRARSVDEHGLVSAWVEFGGNATSAVDFSITTAVAQGFWVEVAHEGGAGATIYTNYTAPRQAIKSVPNGWVLFAVDTHADQKQADGYVWWEVEDKTDGIRGWTQARAGLTEYLHRPLDQKGLAQKADRTRADERSEREALILEAVAHYYRVGRSGASLYDANDDIGRLVQEGLPIELVLAVIAAESGGHDFDNELVSFDCGRGIMQITTEDFVGHWSQVTCRLCKKYERTGGQCVFRSDCKCFPYSNTLQGIFANVKDGLGALSLKLQESLRANPGDNKHAIWAGTVWRYNGRTYRCSRKEDVGAVLEYVRKVGNRLKNLDDYFSNYATLLRESGVKLLGETERISLADFLESATVGAVCSPVELRIRNKAGDVTGVVNGQTVRGVPGVDFEENEFLVLGAVEDLEYLVVGTGAGSYRMVIASGVAGVPALFEATLIRIIPGAVHQYTIDWEAISQGREGVTVQIDEQGDGVFEKHLVTGATLAGE
ncbi:MAG: carboxypeptidase regulatory-like domain-containing protein, partial [Armatimonadota bacterium]